MPHKWATNKKLFDICCSAYLWMAETEGSELMETLVSLFLLFSFFLCCWCQWDLEHEEIKRQDLPHPSPHPTCFLRSPTLESAVTLVCMKSWLQTPRTLSVRPINTEALELSAFPNLWWQPENIVWICHLFCAPKDWGLFSAGHSFHQTTVSSCQQAGTFTRGPKKQLHHLA